MPHESTVMHTESPEGILEEPCQITRSRSSASEADDKLDGALPLMKRAKVMRGDSLVPNLRAEAPRRVTHHHDEDDSDDESSSSNTSNTSLPDPNNGLA